MSDELDAVLENVTIEDFLEDGPEEYSTEEDNVEHRPSQTSPEWSDYVLSLLTKKELKNGEPTCAGLRRVAKEIFGDFSYHTRTNHWSPGHACVTGVITLKDNRVIEGVADVTQENTDAPYCQHAASTADTKAESKALRRLLGYDGVVAEETSRVANLTIPSVGDEDRTEGSITENQVKYIVRICEKTLGKSIKDVVQASFPDCQDINSLSHAQAVTVVQTLSEWLSDETEPYSKFGPFDNNWKSDFCKVNTNE